MLNPFSGTLLLPVPLRFSHFVGKVAVPFFPFSFTPNTYSSSLYSQYLHTSIYKSILNIYYISSQALFVIYI